MELEQDHKWKATPMSPGTVSPKDKQKSPKHSNKKKHARKGQQTLFIMLRIWSPHS